MRASQLIWTINYVLYISKVFLNWLCRCINYVLYISKVFLNWLCRCNNADQFTALVAGEVSEESQLQSPALFRDLRSIAELQPPHDYNHVTMTAALFMQSGCHITRTTEPVLTHHYLCSLIGLIP